MNEQSVARRAQGDGPRRGGRKGFCGALIGALWFLGSPGLARAESGVRLSELDAVKIAVEHNPNLHVALLQETQAGYSVIAEEGLYAPLFDANAGITHGRQPSLLSNGVSVGTTDTIDLGAEISKTFPFGTTLALSLSGQRSLRSYPVLPTSGNETTLGPGYSLGTELSLTQPLLRGAGADVGRASLRAAQYNRRISELAARQTASQLLHDVLLAYWELWYTAEVARIYGESRELAQLQERIARQQVASGAIANIDALPYTTALAQLEESTVVATADLEQHAFSLANLLGDPQRSESELRAADSPADVDDGPTAALALDQAATASYRIKELETQIVLARDQARVARDPARPRLDIEGYLQAQGLGNREVSPAFDQVAELNALSAHVGLIFETPIGTSRQRAQIQSAVLTARIAEKELDGARQQLRADVLNALSRKETARQRIEVAEQTEKVAREQSEAERARFAAGSSVAIAVEQAEDALRQAGLRVVRARVDRVEAELDLANLRGQLLVRYASVPGSLPPAPPSSTPNAGAF